jgi:trimethylamine--corrinoid protein Co-methyltransferase
MKRNLHAGGLRSRGVGVSVLTDDELYDIHLATLEVLSRTGVFVEDEAAMDVFEEGGCVVDREKRIVRIPGQIVEDAIRSAPATLTLAGRVPERDFIVESNRVGFTNFGEGILVVDPRDGSLREPTKDDLAAATRLIDALPEIDVVERPIGAHDVPPEVSPLHNAEAILSNTTKHMFIGPINGVLLKKIVAMAAAIVGGEARLRARPLVSFITCPVSPLKLVRDCCEIIMESARAGMACNILSMAMAGGSSPVTLAGTLVTHNAEVLSGITLSQLTRRGAPVIYGSSTTAMDLRLAAASVGSPELALISAAVVQLSRRYLLPSWVAGA